MVLGSLDQTLIKLPFIYLSTPDLSKIQWKKNVALRIQEQDINPDTWSIQQETKSLERAGFTLLQKIYARSGTIEGSSCIAWKEKSQFGDLFPHPCFPLQDASSVLGGFKNV